MRRIKRIPSEPRFAYAEQRAYEVLVNIGAKRLPVDPFKIGDFYPNIRIVSYTEMQNADRRDPMLFDERNARHAFLEAFSSSITSSRVDGETYIERGTGMYIIVYDDRVRNLRRVRWTIAHELGHIFLGHLVHFEKTALCRGDINDDFEGNGLTEEEYGVLEREAHFFAAAFLSPENVLREITKCKEPAGIMETCEVSEEAAIRRANTVNRIHVGSYPIDDAVVRNFYKFIRFTNGGTAKSFSLNDERLPY